MATRVITSVRSHQAWTVNHTAQTNLLGSVHDGR